jgi:PhnB protein
MELNPYLTYNGRCEAAFKFYEKCLDGKIVAMMTYKDMPPEHHVPDEWRDKILHTRLIAGNAVLMGSDALPDCYETPQGMSVSLQVDKPAEADRIFHTLAENGTVRMPIQETFWAARFGMLVDQFGVPWMINCERPS